MSLLDKIPQDEKYKLNIQHHSENVEIWCVLLDNMTLKVKHWKIEDKSEDLTLREIWLNEVRQLNRLKSIGNSSKYLELLYKSDIDEKGYYLIYKTSEDTITLREFIEDNIKDTKTSRQNFKLKLNYHWIHPLGLKKIENRIILWKNILKIVRAIKILHDQGIVHRNISLDTILVDDSQDNDEESDKFKLSGFEWSIYLNNLKKVDYSPIIKSEIINSSTSNDWWSLGNIIKEILHSNNFELFLSKSEINILKILEDNNENKKNLLNAEIIEKIIKNIINELPQYDNNNQNAYLTSNDNQESDGYKKIRNKLCEFLKKELTYEEVFILFENDLNLTKIDIRQVEFKDNYVYLLKGKTLIYQIDSYKQGNQNWGIGYITNIFEKYPNWSDFSEKIEIHNNTRYIKKSKISSQENDDFFNWNIVVNQFEKNRILNDKEKKCLQGLVLNHAIDTASFMNQKYNVKYEEVNTENIDIHSKSIFEDDNNYYQISLITSEHKDKISQSLNIKKQSSIFYSQFETEELSKEWIIESKNENEIKKTFTLYYVTKLNGKLIFSSKQNINIHFNINEEYIFYPKSISGTKIQLERRNHSISKLIDQQNLLESLTDPAQCLQEMSYDYDLTESLKALDNSKRNIFHKLLTINPNFIVQGPPGVGKTHLISTLVKQIFKDEKSSKVIVTAQSHSTVQVLYDAITKNCETDDLIIIDAFDNDENIEDENTYNKVMNKYIENFSKSGMYKNAIKTYHHDVKTELRKIVQEKQSYQFYNTVLKSANLIFTTTNSKTLERLIRNNINFDLSIMEESAKASGVELISPMLVSHKRVMIGDYLQLPAFGEQTINSIAKNKDLFDYRLILSELNNINFRKDILYKLGLNYQSPEDLEIDDGIKNEIVLNLTKYFSIFRFFAKEAEKIKNRDTKSFGETINTQYRMHPDISKIVSSTVYKNILQDNLEQKEYYLKETSIPIIFKDHKFEGDLNLKKAVIWVNVKDKNDNPNQISDYESDYTNEKEINIIKEILDAMHLNENYLKKKTIGIQILSPYRKQVEKINISLKDYQLNNGLKIENGADFARTVDSFQGDEADIIVISLVRHNSFTPYTRALGFLMDMRRMNVLLSRAKYKMIIIGCFKLFKYWSNYIEENPQLFQKINNELEINNLNFITDFVKLATPDYNLMIDKSMNSKEFKYINFLSTDTILENSNES
ncbi:MULTISPECIES: AAA domain-containing protein [Acinetobacter]|uniref:AAA domain-containing protein n=1 Tax=Acinetobacter entericus TaxID=2989714 RepID=A0ABT3NNI1_9GAMM|nr:MULTISPECIES: AAA domain-containing protein [Acinetobacter]MCH7331264.1 AAA domain-containing protein [Acinetobacter modestus]MCW8041122.1 AAA domain-containing protein [Acinetobacter entericus]